MKFWRMRLRCGFAKDGGEDMWPVCRDHRVAAITYEGVADVDLRHYSQRNPPPGWSSVGGGKGSLSHFAYNVRGGDKMFVADSESHRIVGMGYVSAPLNSSAYRFDPESPIWPKNAPRWCHLIDVDWDQTFSEFPYLNPRAPIQTVLELKLEEVVAFEQSSVRQNHRASGISEEEVDQAQLVEQSYERYTPAALRMISRKHAALSNAFCKWLKSTFGICAKQESHQIDAAFRAAGEKYLAEFKIAYQGDTRRAIREALGQILEYNHYPPREKCDRWLLVLDEKPSYEDIAYIRTLTTRYPLPLNLGWNADAQFEFIDPLRLESH